MLRVAGHYEEALRRARAQRQFNCKKCDMFSSVTGLRMAEEDCTAKYWSRNMTSTVRFSSAIERCLAEFPKLRTAVEIGPHPALKGPATENFRIQGKGDHKYLGTCSRDRDDFEAILDSVGLIIPQGLPLKPQNINAHEDISGSSTTYYYGKVLTDLPGYQWNHSASFWAESRLSRNVRFREYPRHQLLGSRYVDDIPQRPCWRNNLILKEIPWLAQLEASELLYSNILVRLIACVE